MFCINSGSSEGLGSRACGAGCMGWTWSHKSKRSSSVPVSLTPTPQVGLASEAERLVGAARRTRSKSREG